jgi:SulP family sulfate permease
MLVALPSSIAFGVLVYTALGPKYAGQGALAGLLGAAALGLVAPLCGRTPGLISAPCAPAAAVLSALVAALISGEVGGGIAPAAIPSLLALTALFSAGLQFFYGLLGGGRLIKYIPFSVVSGYLSGVGVIIALGQLPKLLGLPPGTRLASGLISPELWRWQGLAVGLVAIGVMGLAPRFTRKVPAAILGLASGVLAYFAIALVSPGLLSLEGNALVIGAVPASGSVIGEMASRLGSLTALDLAAVKLVFFPALTLSVLLSIDTMKTCVVLGNLTRRRPDSDRELRGQGLGNLAAFAVGGFPGAGTLGPTLVNVTSGGRTLRSGLTAGGLVVLVLLFLGRLIAWVPVGALAGILLVVAWRMFDKSLLRLLRTPAGRLDLAVIAAVIVAAVAIDLIAAFGVGVALAVLLFVRHQIQTPVVRRKLYLDQFSSKTRRLPEERAILREQGSQGVFCELQGNLFFGTADQLLLQLEPELSARRYLLLDLRRVQSFDYTAAHLFEQVQLRLAERGGRLLFSGAPSGLLDKRDFGHYLGELEDPALGGGVLIAETLDSALEWIENRILEAEGAAKAGEEKPLELKDIYLFREFDATTLAALAGCMREMSAEPGQRIFAVGDPGDELYLVRRGSVRLLLPLEGGKRHHLATLGSGDFFGEIAFLDHGFRSVDVEAKERTELYVLHRRQFDARSLADPTLGVRVFTRIALTVAERLREADATLRLLEEP